MKNKKKICIIAPSLGMGGIERRLSILANYFQTSNVQVHYVIVYNKEPFYKLDKNIKIYNSGLTRSKESKLSYNIKQFLFVRKQVKKIKPDVILTLGEHLNPYLLLTLSFLKYSHIISDSGSPDIKHKFYITLLKQILYPKAAAIIAQTEAAAEVKRKMLGEKKPIGVIPNPARSIKLYPEINRENIILFVGRLHQEKGLGDLIEIFSKIENRGNWELHIAGSGVHAQQFEKQVYDLGISEQVKFLGKVSDIDRLLAGVKIFAFSSYGEGFPNALLEALSAGVPAVSYDCVAGPSEMIIDGENGYLIEVGDKISFVNKLEFLMNNENKRSEMGEEALKVYDRFNLDKVGKEYLDFILEFANK